MGLSIVGDQHRAYPPGRRTVLRSEERDSSRCSTRTAAAWRDHERVRVVVLIVRHATPASTPQVVADTATQGVSYPFVFGALVIVGLILRVVAMRSTWGQPDGDDAMAMQMAFRASQGHLSLLFWGGNYGGAIITWVEAPLIAIFGMKIWLFDLVDTALMVSAVFILRAIGSRFVSPSAADVAAGTFWFFPALWLFWSSRDYIFWLPAVVFGLATCLSILWWFESPSRRHLVASGLLAGLSIWSYPLVFPLIGPALAILFWALRKDRKALLSLVAAGVVGVAPWLAYFMIHGTAVLHGQTVTGSRFADLKHTVTQVLPTALVGGEKRQGVTWALVNAAPSHLKVLGAGIYVAVILYTIAAAAAGKVALAACGASVIIWPAVLIMGHVPIGVETYRYGVIPVAPILLIAADLLSKVRLVPLLAIAALALVIHTVSADTATFAAAPSCAQSLKDTGDVLVSRHETAVWASYWLSAPLELCSDEHVTVSSVAPLRDHDAEVKAEAASRSIYVVFPGKGLDTSLRTWTAAHHVTARRTVPGSYAIWEFNTKVTPNEMGLDGAF